ncbi:DUF4649 family protein [Streptococcus merionis]|uniref:DUF4649 family protein n=1 Tax=Streptococcus merionis TaxID=400065 RepID=UPI003519A4B2
MVEITYIDSYKQERVLNYDSLEDFFRAFAGCLTVPDYLKVNKVTINEQDIHYSGQIGDLYRDMQTRDLTAYL